MSGNVNVLRPVLMVVLLVSAFYYLTAHLHESSGPGTPVRTPRIEVTEASGSPSYDSEEQENISVYRKAIPSVVNITSTAVAFDFFYGPVPQQGQGSGFIIDADGHILTNYHVIAGARQVEVTLSNKKKYPAQVIGSDRQKDLAILQINAKNLTPATLGDSKSLEVGQKVYAIGNPFGLSGTMTRGIISS